MIEGKPEGNGVPVACSHSLVYDERLEAWLVRDLARARTVLGRHDQFSTNGYQQINPDLSDIRRFLMAPPKRHRLLRRVMVRAFASRRIPVIDQRILAPIAEELVDKLPFASVVNLQEAYVAPYTRRAMLGIIGLDEEVGDRLVAGFRVAHRFWIEQGDVARGMAALSVLQSEAAQACLNGSRSASEASMLGLAYLEDWLGEGLAVEDLVCLMMSLIEAAAVKAHRDLTATLLRHIAVMPHGEQERLITTDAFRAATGEAVRLQRDGYLPRIATQEVDLGGIRVRVGDRVMVAVGDVGVDPQAFAEPFKFDPWRPDQDKDISFGIGLHRCVGENIARQLAVRACRTLLAHRRMSLVARRDTSFDVSLEVVRP